MATKKGKTSKNARIFETDEDEMRPGCHQAKKIKGKKETDGVRNSKFKVQSAKLQFKVLSFLR